MSRWIERQRNVLDFTLSSLLRRRGKMLALMFVYTLVVFALASVMFFACSIKREASILLEDAPEIVVQRTLAGRHEPIPLRYGDLIRRIRGVQSVKERLWGYYYDPVAGANYTLMVRDEPGRGTGSVDIGSGVSRVRMLFQGDTIEFRAADGETVSLEVGNIISHESELVTSDLIVVSRADFRRIFGGSGSCATDLALRVRNSKEVPTIALKIAERLPDTRVILRDDMQRTYEAVFSWRAGIALLILSGGLLAFVILAWEKASGLSANERKEIGILKGVGWETSDVILSKFWEGIILSLTSFLAGVVLAYVHVFFTSAALLSPVLKGWAVLYPDFRPVPFIDASQIVALFFLTVVPYTVTTIIPSWRAATIDPDSVMR